MCNSHICHLFPRLCVSEGRSLTSCLVLSVFFTLVSQGLDSVDAKLMLECKIHPSIFFLLTIGSQWQQV